ncbi:MAG: kinase-like domain-containing protein [Monoraphidium minutum]|nr:MAG: kinase-like domain-containing protein [Monoraphidium minutum]
MGSSSSKPLAPAVRAPGKTSQRAASGTSSARARGPRDEDVDVSSLLEEVDALQQRLALVAPGSPLLALPEAAALLAEWLAADLVGVYAFTRGDGSGGGPPCSVLLAAEGSACAADLPRCCLLAAGGKRAAAPGVGGACAFSVADAARGPAPGVHGVRPLHLATGLRRFDQVLLGPPSAPLGALLVATRDPSALPAGWPLLLRAASTGLLHHLAHPQAEAAAALLSEVHATADPLAAAGVLLRGAARFMQAAANLRVSPRLALLRDGCAEAVLLELPRGGAGPVAASHLPLEHTLLASALARQQARFVKDCGHYMQSCRDIARDVFSRASDLVASVVVVPLIGPGGASLGGLYLASDAPCGFTDVQGPLLSLVHTMAQSVEPRFREMADAALHEAAGCCCDQPRHPSSDGSSCTTSTATGAAASAGAGTTSCGPLPPPPPLQRPLSNASQLSAAATAPRPNTCAMVALLQREVRAGWRRSQEATAAAGRALALEARLGRGGFGSVWRGAWHGAPAAVKVLRPAGDERRAAQDAVEAAVLSMAAHPNIVALYAALTDMVEAPRAASSSGSLSGDKAAPAPLLPRYRRLGPGEDPGEGCPVVNILVLEFCDRGSLRDALRSGAFHRPLPGGSLGVDVAALAEVLLGAACALAHLHALGVVHGDVKADNVLLKTDATRRLGFSPKLADFGLAKVLAEGGAPPNLDGAGTLTHLAPEMLAAGAPVTPAVDAYAFGIMLWELYCRRPAYGGVAPAAIKDLVRSAGARPTFPPHTPPPLAELACDCWAADPAARPGFAEIVDRLEAFLATSRLGNATPASS